MAITAYLNFNGNCREAAGFYAKAFNAPEPKIMNFSEMPPDPADPLDPELGKLVMHTELYFEGGCLMLSDAMPGSSVSFGDSVSIMVSANDEQALRGYWARLKEGATIVMDLSPQFWSPLHGYLVDKFGVGWQVYLDE
jgi:PhnB protein